jgi:hypothetical protein
MFNFLERFRPAPQRSPDARTHVVNVTGGRQIPKELRHSSQLRRRPVPHFNGEQSPKRGMWVVYQGRTGILTDLEAGDIATVMIVDSEEGTNVLEVHCPAAELRQAYHEEIPEKRRPHPDHSVKFGYTRRPA